MTAERTKTMSLLDDALNQPMRYNTKEPEIEVLELVIAWLQGRVSTGQCVRAAGVSDQNSWYYKVMTVLRQAGRTGMIEIRIKAGEGGK